MTLLSIKYSQQFDNLSHNEVQNGNIHNWGARIQHTANQEISYIKEEQPLSPNLTL